MRVLGREDELAEVGRRLDDHRLVTVVGPGGIGKTALARAVAEVHGATFEYGAHVVDLTRVDSAESVGRALAVQLGYDSLDALLTSPGDQPALVIVDNCEHVLDAAAEAVDALLSSCSSPSVVATSRSPLDLPGESLVVVGPLDLPDPEDDDAASSPAIQLFLERAVDAGHPIPADALPAVVALCRALDGVPLAIELAAARTRVMGPAEILGRLDDLGVLDRPGRRRGDRHASLRATIGWSCDQLDEPRQRFFEHLSVPAGRFTAATAHVLRPDPDQAEAQTLDDLDQLVQPSLIVSEVDADGTWFRLLHPVRGVAHDRLVARGDETDARRRFIGHVTQVAAEIAGRGRRGWDDVLPDLLARSDELVAGARHAIDLDDRRSGLFLVSVLWGVVHQAPAQDVAEVAEAALRRWPDRSQAGWADAAATAATCRFLAGNPQGAIALIEQALVVADGSALASCTLPRALGQSRRTLRDLPEAITAFEQGEAAARERGLLPYAEELAVLRAAVLAQLGHLDEATSIAAAVQRTASERGSYVNDLMARTAQGYFLLGKDPAETVRELQGVLRDEGEHRYPGAELSARTGIALAHVVEGDLDAAATDLVTLFERIAERGARPEMRNALRVMASLLERTGEPGVAADLLATSRQQPDVSSFVGIIEDVAPLSSIGDGNVLSPSAALRLALQVGRGLTSDGRAAAAPSGTAEMRRAGDLWSVTWHGTTIHLRATKGLGDLARLVAEPEREVHVLDLASAGVDEGPGDEVLDATARRQLEDRIRELQAEVDDAEAAHDLSRAERATVELDAVVEHLAAALGLGGRPRSGASTAERARQAVTRRLRSTIRRVSEEHEALGRHLEASVRTGSFCVYRPEQATRWDVSYGDGPGA